MARTPKEITDAELAVLELLWERGGATVRKMADGLYPRDGRAQAPTVQKLCERLEAKGLVRRDRSKRPQVYAALVDRDGMIERQLRTLADRLCEGSLTPLLAQLVQGRALSAGERRALRKLVDELDKKGTAKTSAKARRRTRKG